MRDGLINSCITSLKYGHTKVRHMGHMTDEHSENI